MIGATINKIDLVAIEADIWRVDFYCLTANATYHVLKAAYKVL